MHPHFSQLRDRDLHDMMVIIDIDGTLACSGSREMTEDVRATMRELCAHNDVYLFSNSVKYGRNHALAEEFGIPLIRTVWRKPLPWGIRQIRPESRTKPRAVIGDRVLTDGLFARAIGAEFIQVQRLTCAHDGWLTRCVYWSDDVAARFIKLKPRRTYT